VAAGTQGTDAVNVNQLTQQTQQALQSANSYTDQNMQAINSSMNDQFKQQSKRIDQTGAMAAASTQMALNTAGLKTDNRVGAGIGGQGTQTALSVGYQRVLNQAGTATLSVGGSVSNGGNASFGVGAGFGW
jgi:autotransporter adhesin